jgi:hypothetical protein
MIAAGGGAEQTSGLFVRVYETLTVHLNERAANSLLRAQAIIDTVTASKLAAAAAWAAAVAGGGVAVEGAMTSPGQQPAAIMRRVEGTASLAFAKQASQPRSGAKAFRSSQDRRAKRNRGRAPAKGPAASLTKRTSSPARPRPRPSPPPATTAASTTAAPHTSAASAGAAPAGSAAAGEFGFEGP